MRLGFLLFCFCLSTQAFALDLLKQPCQTPGNCFEDTVQIAVFWNSATEAYGYCGATTTVLPSKPGQIGLETKEFISNTLQAAGINTQIKYYSQPEIGPSVQRIVINPDSSIWVPVDPLLDTNNFYQDFGGKPDVIIYSNAGYKWVPHYAGGWHDPLAILKKAALDGVAIVNIGDEAAYTSTSIFPEIQGPDGDSVVIPYHSYPGMEDAIKMDSLWITINTLESDKLAHGGFQFGLSADSLFFKPHGNYGDSSEYYRCQADADLWDIHADSVEFSTLAATQIGYTADGVWNSEILGMDYYIGVDTKYYALAALEDEERRLLLLNYQPDMLQDTNASAQILYNALYMAANGVVPTPTSPDTLPGDSLPVDTTQDSTATDSLPPADSSDLSMVRQAAAELPATPSFASYITGRTLLANQPVHSVQIYSSTGSLVHAQSKLHTQQVALPNVRAGVYWIRLKNQHGLAEVKSFVVSE